MSEERSTRPARAVIYGVGEMGSLAARLCVDRGVEIVGAIARSPGKAGRDLAEVIGLSEALDVSVRTDAEALLTEARADVAIVSVASRLEVMQPHFELCAAAGTNVLTLEEESFFPWAHSPALAGEVDAMARQHGISIVATGLQDAFWFDAVRNLMAGANRVDAVRGRSTWNSDDYGPTVEASLLIGQDPSEVSARGVFDQSDRRTVAAALHAIAAAHGLSVIGCSNEVFPVIAERETQSPVTGRVVHAGRILGIANLVTLKTQQGIELSLEMAGYLHGPDETSVNEWHLTGEPNLTVRTDPFPGREVTCTALLNRVPDVIRARPGLLSIDQLPPPRYRHGPLTILRG